MLRWIFVDVPMMFSRPADHEPDWQPSIILGMVGTNGLSMLYRGTCLNAMKRYCICSLLIPPKRFDIFPPITGGCSEGLGVV